MTITEHSPGSYEYEGKECYLNVIYLIGGTFISVFADTYIQMFTCRPCESLEEASAGFITIEALRRAAQIYKLGITNAGKFMESVVALSNEPRNNLSKGDVDRLKDFVVTRKHMEPETIRMQLRIAGYERIADSVVFKDEDPILERSCKDFMRFLDTLRKCTKEM